MFSLRNRVLTANLLLALLMAPLAGFGIATFTVPLVGLAACVAFCAARGALYDRPQLLEATSIACLMLAIAAVIPLPFLTLWLGSWVLEYGTAMDVLVLAFLALPWLAILVFLLVARWLNRRQAKVVGALPHSNRLNRQFTAAEILLATVFVAVALTTLRAWQALVESAPPPVP
jgi:hypothetical protein